MLLHVEDLSKYYGKFQALKSISFSLKKGEITGFLGANGAGKSTTMRILSGCLAASSGTVTLLGKDIQQHSIAVKRNIGYVPEVPPLYPQMKVIDYLDFVATIKDVPSPKESCLSILQTLELENVAQQHIDQLSKGYKQRVGLAQALIHRPALLILDEPTSGLDPGQRSALRKLLLQLKEDGHSILLSTHILSEVEAICDRVVIISQGEIKAEQAIQNEHLLEIHLRQSSLDFEAQLSAELQHTHIRWKDDRKYRIETSPEQIERVAQIAAQHGLLYFAPFHALEELYLQVSGEHS